MKMDRQALRRKRHLGVRAKVRGTIQRPRVSVFRSNRNIYAQLVDDEAGHTLASASDQTVGADQKAVKLSKVEKAREVGQALAKKAHKLKITQVVFDRGGYRYHGRVRALAEALRGEGIKF